MAKYKKCPRCDLNFIPVDEEMCDVCKAELGLSSKITLLDDIMEDEQLKLCPVCKTAYINEDEQMCENCLLASQREENAAKEDDEGWRTYLDDDADEMEDDVEIPLDELNEEFGDSDFEDEENLDDDYEKFDDFDDFDDVEDIGDEDDDEDDEQDDDEDDDF